MSDKEIREKDRLVQLKQIQNHQDLDSYNIELEKDVRVTVGNIREKSMMVSSLRCKWLNYYTFEKENLRKLTSLKEKYTKSKITSKKITDPLIKMKSELALETGDEKLMKINEMMKDTKVRIEFLERAQNIMNDFGYNIRNAIESFKLEMK